MKFSLFDLVNFSILNINNVLFDSDLKSSILISLLIILLLLSSVLAITYSWLIEVSDIEISSITSLIKPWINFQ